MIHTALSDPGKLVTLITGKWHCLLFAGTVDEVFVTGSLNRRPKNPDESIPAVPHTANFEFNCTQW